MSKVEKIKIIALTALVLLMAGILGGFEADEAEQRANGRERCEYQQIATATYMCK